MYTKMVYLTKEQQERLDKLEQEMLQKKIYEEKNRERLLEVSKETGIPYNLVDTDVVKIGSMLGLIGTKKSDGEENLMDILFGRDETPKLDYSKVPPYFTFAPVTVSEMEKLEYHRDKVKHACNVYHAFLGSLIQFECQRLEEYVTFGVQQPSIESFVETVNENMDVVMDMVLEEEDDELWKQLRVLRNSISCIIPLCEYKKVVSMQVVSLLKKYPIETIFKNISYIDAKLTLFPKSEDKSDKGEINRLINSIVIRSYTRDPELKAFDMEVVKRECLTPIYMFLPLDKVFHHFILGPYNNDAIGYLKPNFYILKSINEGIRMWILDENLAMFSEQIRLCVLTYCEKLYATLNNASLDVSILAKNIQFISNSLNFKSYICNIVCHNSMIIPTEADVFDNI